MAEEYKLDKNRFCRPFYPGGDYQSEDYTGKIVVDNPPFSILAEIQDFYKERRIPFFLFAPNVTCFSKGRRSTAVCVGAGITYENKAKVLTSFVTNLEEGTVARTAPDLYERIKVADDENTKGNSLPKFEYPPQLVTAAMLSKLSKYGQSFRLMDADCSDKISALESQHETGDVIFGGGFLISKKAAAEKAAAKVWKLSEKELEIIRSLG